MELCDLLSKIDPLSASYILQGKLQNIKSYILLDLIEVMRKL